MKILGIDYGLERTGLAITDPEGKIAFPLLTLHLRNFSSRGALLDTLAELARRERAEIVVLGLPVREDGSEGPMCATIRKAATRIERRLLLPLYFVPETLSSEQARIHLRSAGRKGMNAKAVLDQQAACEIINTFLAMRQSP